MSEVGFLPVFPVIQRSKTMTALHHALSEIEKLVCPFLRVYKIILFLQLPQPIKWLATIWAREIHSESS